VGVATLIQRTTRKIFSILLFKPDVVLRQYSKVYSEFKFEFVRVLDSPRKVCLTVTHKSKDVEVPVQLMRRCSVYHDKSSLYPVCA